ncbi:MAG: hypothetical protein IPL12_14865 [Bacteroidetes bacterium]|nr:hypothetical protein [Bacteroidota bacterium]
MQSLQGLSSPQRQLLYLAGLNITSKQPEKDKLKHQYSDEEFEHMKKLLNEIENGYEHYFYPKPDDVVDEDWKMRRMIAMPTFLSYFNQGLLNYEEQIIERVHGLLHSIQQRNLQSLQSKCFLTSLKFTIS